MPLHRAALLGLLAALVPSIGFAQLWTPQSSGTTNLLESTWFTDSLNGWAVGDLGTSLVTADGGQTWTSFFLTGQDLGDVAFDGAGPGLIVGDNGLIFRTTNGGTTWTPVASGTANNLRAVAFGGGGAAYAGGRDGTIVRSTNDGASWTLVETGVDRYRDAAAAGTRAWLVGDGGVIRATTNSGTTWFNQAGGAGQDLHGVFFLDMNEGWIAGQNNTLLYTANGGATWTSRNAGIFVGPDAVFFVDSNEGWAVGDLGSVFHTTNGGLLWIAETSGTSNGLSDVFFVSGLLGWTVGDLGTILVRDQVTDAPQIAAVSADDGLRSRAAPNPVRTSTSISYTLPRPSPVEISILDARGRLIRELSNESGTAGTNTAVWDGLDSQGATVFSGVYFYRIRAAGKVDTGSLTVLR